MSVVVTLLGDCSWQPLSEPVRSTPPNELPSLVEVWLGLQDQVETFRGDKAVGSQYLGGYIIDNTPREHSPGMMSCDLKVALPPDFQKYRPKPSTSLKTATKTASVSGSNLMPAYLVPDGVTVPDPLQCTREVSYYAPETIYSYFASKQPEDARFDKVISSRQPRIIRSVIKAALSSGEVTFTGNATAAIVTALYMPVQDKCTATEAEPIDGTHWWRCQDTVTRELLGDT